jgi:hypothetical protein
VPNPQQPARASELPRQIPIGLAALQVSRKHVTAVVFHLVFNQLADVDGFSLERGERVLFAPKGLPARNQHREILRRGGLVEQQNRRMWGTRPRRMILGQMNHLEHGTH